MRLLFFLSLPFVAGMGYLLGYWHRGANDKRGKLGGRYGDDVK